MTERQDAKRALAAEVRRTLLQASPWLLRARHLLALDVWVVTNILWAYFMVGGKPPGPRA